MPFNKEIKPNARVCVFACVRACVLSLFWRTAIIENNKSKDTSPVLSFYLGIFDNIYSWRIFKKIFL